MAEIRQLEYAVVRPYSSRAAKERVSLADAPSKTWWGAFDGDTLLGFAFLSLKDGKARIGGVYFLPAHRGKGAGKQLMLDLIERAQRANVSCIEYVALSADWWIRNGFKVIRPTRNGVTWLSKPV